MLKIIRMCCQSSKVTNCTIESHDSENSTFPVEISRLNSNTKLPEMQVLASKDFTAVKKLEPLQWGSS